MRAIVCNKCGKVQLLEQRGHMVVDPIDMWVLIHKSTGEEFDLCNECGEALLAEVRRENG